MSEIEKLKNIIVPGSSVGIHEIKAYDNGKKVDQYGVYENIEANGLKVTYPCYGLVGNITMLNPIDEFGDEDIAEITSSDYRYKVIVAIPKTIEAKGEEYYLGNFRYFKNGYGKDDNRALSLPINWLGYLPKEFVVGLYATDNNGKNYLLTNSNYVGFMSDKKMAEFYDSFVDRNKDNLEYHGVFKINDECISRADFMLNYVGRDTYYLREFNKDAPFLKGRSKKLKKK